MYPVLTVIALAVFLLVITRWSRKSFEKKHGRITLKEKCQTGVLLILWLTFFTIWMQKWSVSFGWFYSVMLVLNFPLIKSTSDRSLLWRIQETVFLALIVLAPFVLLHYMNV